MHGCERNEALATRGRPSGQSASNGPCQRPHALRPMVDGSHEHGARLANPSQPPASQGQQTCRGPSDVEGIRPTRGRDSGYQEEPRKEERVASVGQSPGDSRQSLHPQEQADLVNVVKPTGAVSIETVLRLLEHQRYRCGLTGRLLTPQTSALDHIMPIRFGGEHVIKNTQVLHKDVNRAKGSLTSDEFIGMCREVVRWSDSPITRKESQ